jgi:hypothetical protein
MKLVPRLTALLLAARVLHAEDSALDPTAATGISGPIADGTPPPAVEKQVPITFAVLNSVTRRVHVTESSEMPELPPVQGIIKRTVQLVADPGLPDPPPPLPPLPIDDAAVQGRLAEARERYKETQILFVSARVLDFERTILDVHPNGEAKESVTVVSSIDYNDFSGFATFSVAGEGEDGTEEVRQYALIMAINNEIAANMGRFAARDGRTYEAPQLPTLPEGEAPSYVVLEGNNEEALQAIHDMHVLYSVEGDRMNASRIAREKAREERKAYLLANPPKPEDVTVKFWKRSKPSTTTGR